MRHWLYRGWSSLLKVVGNVTIRQSAYDFLFDFNRNYASILYRQTQPAICQKSSILTHSTCIGCPCRGDTDPGGIQRRFLVSENQNPLAIMWCCLCDHKFSRFSRTLTCDRQADRQTQGYSIYHTSIASGGNKTKYVNGSHCRYQVQCAGLAAEEVLSLCKIQTNVTILTCLYHIINSRYFTTSFSHCITEKQHASDFIWF